MKIAIITERKSDFSILFEKLPCEVEYLTLKEAQTATLDIFDAFCILGGTQSVPLTMHVDVRLKLEQQREKGKRMFVEFCYSFGDTYSQEPKNTAFERLIFSGDETEILKKGDILDDHYNSFSMPYVNTASSRPILYYGGKVSKHDKIEFAENAVLGCNRWGLWYYDENIIISSFRFCDFIKARLAPFLRWKGVAEIIVSHLLGEKIDLDIEPKYHFRQGINFFEKDLDETISAGFEWFDNMNILIDGGKSGVLEGLSHNIAPDGFQYTSEMVRNDCSGEVGGAYFFDYLLSGNEKSLETYNNLASFSFDKMQIKTGHLKGMMRWTTTAWGVCYQDDVSRTILSTLLKMVLTENRDRLSEVLAALDFLVATTGKDGLRRFRTDNIALSEADMENLRNEESGFASAHYNAYYHAVLLLAYQVSGIECYKEVAEKGLSSIMAVFPNTVREQSETQELCRLIFPIACLYGVTKKEEHKDWLYKVTAELLKHRHPFGGYMEWDTDYKAACCRNADGECALLAENGDPIADLLYSQNWLPLGFAYAFNVTGDKYFANLWKNIAGFFIRTQILSDDKKINGSWARGFDMDKCDIYGVPHDVGWGPCCAESGWTCGEVLIGLQYGKLIMKL